MEEEQDKPDAHEKKTIKTLVISGGGLAGFTYYGILKETNKQKIWNIEDIQKIYGTSAGAMLSVILCLKYDWEEIDDYLIKRPWNNVFKIDMGSLIDALKKKGIFDIKFIEEIFSSLIKGKDLTLASTLLDLYEYSKIEVHMFCINVDTFELIDLSHKTHPDWKIIEAVYSSMSFPAFFSPHLKDGCYYCDGAFSANYPIDECLNSGTLPEEIMGISGILFGNESMNLAHESSLLDYLIVLMNNLMRKKFSNKKKYKLALEYNVNITALTMDSILKAIYDKEERSRIIDIGVNMVREST